MPRGNPDNLRAAAQRKREAATQRAETALNELIASREPITFRGLAKTAGVSIDFLCRSPLRARVEQLRADQQHTPPVRQAREADQPPSQSNVVRALTAQIAELKQRHRAETEHLQAALAAAHGENLELRRQLGRHGRTATA
jgi:acyl transferase domain-containing protein